MVGFSCGALVFGSLNTLMEGRHTAVGGAVGQDGSSTRQEIAGWLAALTLPFRICYATDSAALIAKTNKLLQAAVNFENL